MGQWLKAHTARAEDPGTVSGPQMVHSQFHVILSQDLPPSSDICEYQTHMQAKHAYFIHIKINLKKETKKIIILGQKN